MAEFWIRSLIDRLLWFKEALHSTHQTRQTRQTLGEYKLDSNERGKAGVSRGKREETKTTDEDKWEGRGAWRNLMNIPAKKKAKKN